MRGTLYVLLPLSIVLAIALVSQGVVQSFSADPKVALVEPGVDASGAAVTNQTIAIGPAASQVAIKQLGTNGGGFFNANSAHPLENPTPLSNLLQLVAILLIPAALCFTFGEMVGDRRQGWALLMAMTVIFVPLLIVVMVAEQSGNPVLTKLGLDQVASASQSGGNMEGKETRFGIANSALWAVSTTAASNGSVNAMHDSLTPLGGLVPMWLMQIGEVVFGGVGSGLYGMLVFAIIAVFIAGLMVGRTPEYLGKKISAFEVKMAVLAILFPCAMVLLGTAAGVLTEAGRGTIANPGAMDSARCSTHSRRRRTTTAAHSPAWEPTLRSTTACWVSRCSWGGSGSCSRSWQLPVPWREESRPGRRRHSPHPHTAVRHAARVGRPDCGRPQLFSGAGPRPIVEQLLLSAASVSH